MSIKKQYQEIINLLQANTDKKVKSVLDEIYEMCKKQSLDSTHLTNEDGTIKAIFCYYHKQWELVEEIDYGNKKSSTTGLNTMCKLGVKGWTKTQRELKKIESEILEELETGKLDPTNISQERIKRQDEMREKIFKENSHEDHLYHTLEELS